MTNVVENTGTGTCFVLNPDPKIMKFRTVLALTVNFSFKLIIIKKCNGFKKTVPVLTGIKLFVFR
jgi:hypothetical protein